MVSLFVWRRPRGRACEFCAQSTNIGKSSDPQNLDGVRFCELHESHSRPPSMITYKLCFHPLFLRAFSLPPSKITDFCHLPRQREADKLILHNTEMVQKPACAKQARRFPFSLCETAVVQTAEGNSTEFAVRRTPRVTFAPTVYDHIQTVLSPPVSACLFSPSVKNHRFLPPPSSEGGRQAYSTQYRNGAKTCLCKTSATFPVFALRNGGCSNRRGKLDGVRFCELQ